MRNTFISKPLPGVIWLLFFLSFSLTTVIGQGQQDRPNILWITFEDTSPQFIGCYGNKEAKTPVIDQLAAEGIRFTNAFSTGTVCSPSRTTLITGVKTYKAGNGHHRSKYPLPEFIKGFPYYLREAGYYATNNAKTDYNVADEKSFIKETWDASSGKAGWWDRKADQPFFAVFNFNDSHQSRTMTEPYNKYQELVLEKLRPEERVAENEFAVPPFYRDSPEMRKHHARVYNALKLTDNKIGTLLQKLKDDGLMERTIIFLFADHGEGIPRGKTNGINLGYRVPFIAWFPEKYKHLSPWGNPGTVTEELISFEDLAPTMIHLAGGKKPAHLRGRVLTGPHPSPKAKYIFLSSDRSDNGIDMVRTVTDGRYVYSRNYMTYMPELRYIRYMEIGEIKQQIREDYRHNLLSPSQKSLFESRPAEFLYDIENDPWEETNLAPNPQFSATLENFREQLGKEILASKDVMFLPEYEIEEISRHSTPYELRLDKTKYDLKEITAAAALSGVENAKTAKAQARLLNNKNKIVRYWAAVGLRNQSSERIKPHLNSIEKAMKDPYPPVAITAAAILYGHGQDEDAEELLKKSALSSNEHLSLMTINYLLYSPSKNNFVETIREVHAKKTSPYAVKAASMDFLGSLGLVPNTFEFRE